MPVPLDYNRAVPPSGFLSSPFDNFGTSSGYFFKFYSEALEKKRHFLFQIFLPSLTLLFALCSL